MEVAKNLTRRSVSDALNKIIFLHATEKNEDNFKEETFNVLQTLLNNIHMAQGIMFSNLVARENILDNSYKYPVPVPVAKKESKQQMETEANECNPYAMDIHYYSNSDH